MATITELKEQTITGTPLLLFDCELRSGSIERWSTHRATVDGATYEARILRHNLFEIRSGSEDGIDAVAKVSISLANADSHFSQIERNTGWKGARVTIRFVFFDLRQNSAASESTVLFRGVANPPEEITESAFRLTVSNSLNLQRALLPDVRVQRRCPWKFPGSAAQREEAAKGGMRGQYSPFFRCGYSPDIEEGTGNLNGSEPYVSCDYTRTRCDERGMFRADKDGKPTRRFGGIEFVPPTTQVRSYGDKGFHASGAVENEARYNDFVPLVYGTAWYAPLVVFSKNDGNLTRMEVVLGSGEMQGVLKVLVNNIEIPPGRAGANMTATGWYNMITAGNRTGSFNYEYLDGAGNPIGDPYGSMAALSVVVPNRINDGRALPRIQVLAQGLKLSQFDTDGSYLGDNFTNNPAWILLDLLQRSAWKLEDIDMPSFARAAACCAEPVAARDLYGNPITVPRFQCNFVLQKRRSAADVIRGVRNASRILLSYGDGGLLQARVENTLALDQPEKPEGSNSTTSLEEGWPAYEFGDGSTGVSGILRKDNGEPSIRLWSRSTAESPNRVSVEFQDEFNDYQQDSLSLVDIDDAVATGQEISTVLPALGVPNFSQASRLARLYLDKSQGGNTYVDFETSIKGFGLKPGDIITITYLKEDLERQPFRILKISPGLNYRTVLITAQIHNDLWYADDRENGAGGSDARRQQSAGAGLPRPLTGTERDETGDPRFGISERIAENTDGGSDVTLAVHFVVPPAPKPGSAGIPLVSLAARIETTGGALRGDQTLYYATTALDENGGESALSFLVRATIPPGTITNTVTLTGLSFDKSTAKFHVYRGPAPDQLLEIASDQTPASEFNDAGLTAELSVPPDGNYDHANFYWRSELQPEYPATSQTETTVESTTLAMGTDAFRGMVVRITRGRGAGQERAILSNTQTTVTIRTPWDVLPDTSSSFVIAESGWHFGAVSKTSPVEFQVPNREGETVHVSGRAANVHDEECAYELSPLTRWRIAGAGLGGDADVPPRPFFGIAPTGEGTLELSAIAFEDLNNTRTIATATLKLNYWNELNSPAQAKLTGAIGPTGEVIGLSSAAGVQKGSLLQIDSELMFVEEVLEGDTQYRVRRGEQGSGPNEHLAEAPVFQLDEKIFIVPFARDFFGSPSSGSFCYPIYFPDARVASAELFVTNGRGNSESKTVVFTDALDDSGLRTLSGGQFAIQVEGNLAVQSDAAPPLVVQDTHSVRELFAMVREAPAGGPVEMTIQQDEAVYAVLSIPANSKVSNVVSGFGLPPLRGGSQIKLNITKVPQGTDSSPGRDLTVSIRM